jgi:hypothetical protein
VTDGQACNVVLWGEAGGTRLEFADTSEYWNLKSGQIWPCRGFVNGTDYARIVQKNVFNDFDLKYISRMDCLMRVKNKKTALLSIILFFVLCGVLAYFFVRTHMNQNTIRLSELPSDELWSIEYAEEMQEKAFNIGIPMVSDKEALLELIIQAWQWDKNAMIQYARILQNEDEIPPSKGESLDDFIIEYRQQIVDRQGRLLNEPQVLRLPYRLLMVKLAELKYPYPANYVAVVKMMGESGYDEQGRLIPYSSDMRKTMLDYIRYSIDGGYRNQSFLADTILWGTGYESTNPQYQALNRLADPLPGLTASELTEALAAYRVCASHGSSYCMMRLAEAYYHGIGVEKNIEYAYVWSELSRQAYIHYLEWLEEQTAIQFGQNNYKVIDSYNSSIMELIEKEISVTQLEAATALISDIKSTLMWDYETWGRRRDPVPPLP